MYLKQKLASLDLYFRSYVDFKLVPIYLPSPVYTEYYLIAEFCTDDQGCDNMLYAMCNVQCAMCNVQCAMCNYCAYYITRPDVNTIQ